MARRKKIDESTLIGYADEFLVANNYKVNKNGQINCNQLAKFINEKYGYNLTPKNIRDCAGLFQHIREIINERNSSAITLTHSTYTTLDIRALFESNKSKEEIINILIERDKYYERIQKSAVVVFDEYHKMEEIQSELLNSKARIQNLEEEVSQLHKSKKELSARIKKAEATALRYKRYIEEYVNPEIAKQFLYEDKIIDTPSTVIDEEKLKSKLIDTTLSIPDSLGIDADSDKNGIIEMFPFLNKD